MEIIETQDLTRKFKDQVAVDKLNLRVERGQIYGLIGPNGAGKTTTVRMLTTLLNPSEGTAKIDGHDILKEPHEVRKVIGYVPQEAQADEALTGREHLILQGRLYGMDPQKMGRRIDEVLELVGLKQDADKRALEYSGGMRKLMDIATGLLHSPQLLFLDEPTAGVDVSYRKRLVNYIQDLPATGMTIFLTSHFLEEVDQLAKQVALFDKGRIVIQGTPADLKASIGTSILEITVSPIEAFSPQTVVSELRQIATLGRVITDGNRIKVFTSGGDDVLMDVRRHLDRLRVPVSSLTIAQPTLDDVFLHHIRREEN
jgi:ABC-2 type transport system ATP-binding protein